MTDKKEAPQTEQPQTKADVKAEIGRLLDKLKKIDGQKHSGAPSRLPKGRMLDATALEKKDPDHHYCFVNTDDVGNLQTHLDDGYQEVPESECAEAGVRHQVGETVLMRVPREVHEAARERADKLNESRLKAHKTEMREAVTAVAHQLQREYGLSDHDVRRLLIDDEG